MLERSIVDQNAIGTVNAQIPENSSVNDIFRASAKVCIASRLGFAPPVSILDMYVRAKPHLSAKAS